MKIRSIFIMTAMLLMSFAVLGQGDKEEAIKKLMVNTGMADMSKQIMAQMIGSIQQSYPDVPSEFWAAFMAEVDTEQLIQLMIPIYDKYYTYEEVQALSEFYETPVGKKTIQVMPALMQESMAVGQQWGMELGQRVAEKLKNDGY